MRPPLILIMLVLASVGYGQTNTFPATGKVGIGTTSPATDLHIKTDGTNSPWLALDKNTGQETGIQFRKSGSVMFYLYSDNTDNDALKIQSTTLSGEGDAAPRIYIPYDNKDLYFGLSGGNVAIGHKTPYSPSRLHIKAAANGPWSFISEAGSNDRIIGISHDGTNGMISTSYLGNSGHSPLQFRTSNQPRITIGSNGNTGIGTENPLARLHVENGDLLLQNQTSGYPVLWLKNVSGNNFIRLDYNSIIGSGGNLLLRAGGANALILNDEGGNVGIGTPSPTEKLTVNGTIYGKEVRVDLNVTGPDYVFKDDYKLLSLTELERFIQDNGHLPEVPSALEMEANGLRLAEMDMILLKKVEELTLHLIKQSKVIEEQTKRIEELEAITK